MPADFTKEAIVRDAQDGRAKLSFGNPVLCMEWTEKMVEKYGDSIADVTDKLTSIKEDKSQGINPVSDVSILIARLERLLGEMGY